MLQHTFLFDGRRLDPGECAQAVLKTSWLALQNEKNPEQALKSGLLLGAFRGGLSRLVEQVSLPTAKALDQILRSRDSEHQLIRETWIEIVLSKKLQPANFSDLLRAKRFKDIVMVLNHIGGVIRPEAFYEIRCRLNEFPLLPSMSGSRVAWKFHADNNDVAMSQNFLSALARNV